MSKDRRVGLPATSGNSARTTPRPVQASCLDTPGLEMLRRGLGTIDPRLENEAFIASLVRYVRELELWNPRLGLVEAAGHDLITKHLLDCLAAIPLLMSRLEALGNGQASAAALRLADIGSGAGLPGILLTLALRHIGGRPFTMTLVEKQQRRVGFLLNVKAILALDMLEVCQESLEQVSQREGGSFDLVTARAFRSLEPAILGELESLLKSSGELFLYKGRRDRVAEELATAGVAGNPRVRVEAIAVPGLDEERHVVVIQSSQC